MRNNITVKLGDCVIILDAQAASVSGTRPVLVYTVCGELRHCLPAGYRSFA